MPNTTPKSRGLFTTIMGRLSASETLISDRHAESMLVGLLLEADRVEDPAAAWDEVRGELCASWDVEDGPETQRKPFIYRDGVAIIPVHGVLINRFNYCWGYVTGYDFIRRQKNLALADPDVKLIVFDHDSPGGEAAGCDELAREIFQERATKPSMALVNTLSASAGYWLAAASTRIVCAPSGTVGSIGVYIQHMMVGRMLQELGIDMEYVKRGEYKTSGNPYEPLSEKDRAYLQEMVDERYDEFTTSVAEFRGIEESVARDTEARVMRPTEALALGLIDAAVSPANAVSDFLAELGQNEPNDPQENEPMADAPEMTSEQRAAVAAETKARIKGIMTNDAAKGREALAEHLAYNTEMSVNDAVATMSVSPKAEDPAKDEPAKDEPAKDEPAKDEAKSKSNFENAMDTGKNPDIGGSVKGEEGEDKVSTILRDQGLATGRKFATTA